MNFKKELRNKFNFFTKNVYDVFTFSYEIIECVQSAIEKPTAINIVKNSLKIMQSISYYEISSADEYFAGEWKLLFPSELNFIIMSIMKKQKHTIHKLSNKNNLIKTVIIDDIEIGWGTENGKMSSIGFYTKYDNFNRAKERVGKLIWEEYKNNHILIKKSNSEKKNEYGSDIEIECDDKIPPIISQKSLDMSKYLSKCFDSGINRSQLYYGPPGTGKSTFVRTLVDTLSMRSIRLRVEDLAEMDNSIIYELIKIFQPDAIIFDDIDRACLLAHMLEMLDDLKRNVKLIVATANNKDELDAAILRPGRFDELIEFKFLEKEIIEEELGEENIHLYESVKEWPIVYIKELVIRRKFMDEKQALVSLVELQDRINNLKNHISDDDTKNDDNIVDDWK